MAAPTAGLHFTENILKFFKEKGINIATLTLHARWETFKYITALNIPKLTPLIIMASAFSSREIMLKAYKEAVKKYRFFSYGDSMLIL
ncbi:S-adenosylmethionine:tRNA ribosyltransferase-isomerase [Candidatus Endomicrobiellum trichonymphae]|uniref:S-adenosylmethionine:tRNA ribosyltransferase-isomerase n=1 Tax=Endomicrobium trichonymphae TaxID=1408204 RepID=UPI000BBAE95C